LRCKTNLNKISVLRRCKTIDKYGNSQCKAKFLSRYEYRNFNDDIVELEYEYRGHKYTVEENRSKGNEPLSWQHRNAQARIDSMIEMEEREKECDTNTNIDDCLKMLWNWWEN
jgi:hypothetical protein